MRKILLTLVLGSLLFTLAACGKKTEVVETPREDQFIVGLECAYAPYNWKNSTQTLTSYPIENVSGYCDGYDVKIAKIIATHLDKELVIKAIEWDGLILALNEGSIDAIIAGMSPTEERKLTIDFSDVYFRSEQVVVVQKDGKFANAKSINDFSKAKITAQQGTLQVDLTSQLVGATVAPALPDYSSLVAATSSGTVDGFIAELPVALKVISTNPSLTYISFAEGNGFSIDEAEITTSIGLRKTTDPNSPDAKLKQQINDVLHSISFEKRNEWMTNFVSK